MDEKLKIKIQCWNVSNEWAWYDFRNIRAFSSIWYVNDQISMRNHKQLRLKYNQIKLPDRKFEKQKQICAHLAWAALNLMFKSNVLYTHICIYIWVKRLSSKSPISSRSLIKHFKKIYNVYLRYRCYDLGNYNCMFAFRASINWGKLFELFLK